MIFQSKKKMVKSHYSFAIKFSLFLDFLLYKTLLDKNGN